MKARNAAARPAIRADGSEMKSGVFKGPGSYSNNKWLSQKSADLPVWVDTYRPAGVGC